ncbi:MAG: helix-turn-helix domain-containing protein [Actinomycetota bacterium]|nr:helix-turn-helix domain-containing protein [Actinomycetota bacterium]
MRKSVDVDDPSALATDPGRRLSGVGVVDKTVAILEVLAGGPAALAPLAGATGMPRATAHRLAVALEIHGFVERDPAGRFVLGHRLVALGRAAGPGGRSLADVAMPALAALRDRTGESTQLYVVSGGQRVCVASLESPHGLRTMVAVGAALPMELGSAARALIDHPDLGRRGWVQSVEERQPGVASVSAPVRIDGAIVAAVSVSGPLGRTTRHPGRRYGEAVVDAARAVEQALGSGDV